MFMFGQSHDVVNSVDELIGRIDAASHCEVTIGAENDPRVYKILGLPQPSEVTDSQLSELRPLYYEILSSWLEIIGDDSLLRMFHKNDTTASLLLCFLEFPIVVQLEEKDENGILFYTAQQVLGEDDVQLSVVPWLRELIKNHDKRSVPVVERALRLLSEIDTQNGILSEESAKTIIARFVFGIPMEDMRDSLRDLRRDLAGFVVKEGLSVSAVVNCARLPYRMFTILGDEEKAKKFIYRASQEGHDSETVFEVLESKYDDGELTDEELESLEKMIFPDYMTQNFLELISGQSASERSDLLNTIPDENRKRAFSKFIDMIEAKEAKLCGRYGCKEPGTLSCSRCKLVGYCSKQCQKDSWKEHKKVCKPKTKDDEKKIAGHSRAIEK